MKVRLSKLRDVIAERLNVRSHVTPFDVLVALNEDATDNSSTNGHSLDAQLDRYISQYEKSASGEQQNESRLLEADDDDAGDDTQTPASNQSTKLTTDSIDVESFVNDVVNLIENHDNLLEFQSTIVRRALNFLAKTYDDDVIEAAKNSFREDHSIVPGETSDEREADDFRAPRAGEAGPL